MPGGEGSVAAIKPPKLSLKARTLRAGSWTLVAHFAGQALRLLSSLIMTRILAPEMFGVMAIATVVQISVALLSDIGIHQSIVQHRKGNSPEFLDSAWSLQIARGFMIWAACVAVGIALYLFGRSGWIPERSVYASGILPWIIASATFSSVITGFASTKLSTSNRDLELRKVAFVELTAQLSTLLVMIAVGWWTRSIWSVVVGGLCGALVSVCLSHYWLSGHNNRFRWDPVWIKEIVSFGRWIFLSSAIGVVASNADRLLLGIWLSASLLGIYSIALNLATVVEGLAYKLFGNLSFAVFSEVAREAPSRLRELYFRMRGPADAVLLGAAGLLYAASQSIVDLLYDARYAEAGSMLKVLSFGLFFTRYSLSCSTYVALGKPQYLTVIQATNLTSMLISIPGLYGLFGAAGAIWAVALYRLPSSLIAWLFNARLGIHSTLFEIGVIPAWAVGWGLGWSLSQVIPR